MKIRDRRASAYYLGAGYDESATADHVVEQDDGAVPTGLLDHAGRPIYRRRETVAFGFVGVAGGD